jgi:hypothetical protein
MGGSFAAPAIGGGVVGLLEGGLTAIVAAVGTPGLRAAGEAVEAVHARQPSRSRVTTSASAAPQAGQRTGANSAAAATQVSSNWNARLPRRTSTGSTNAGT